MKVSGDDWNLRDQLEGDLTRIFQTVVVGAGIETSERGNASANGVHWRRFPGQLAQNIDNAARQRAIVGKRALQCRQLSGIGQAIFVQQVDDFFVGNFAGEFVDVVTGVNQFADVAFD